MRGPIKPFAQERAFGRGVGAVLVLIAGYSVWRGRSSAAEITGATGVVLLVLSAVAPAALKWPSKAWWMFAHALGWVNTRVLLTLFFMLVIVPVGLFFKLFGHDLLDRHGRGSSWRPYPLRRDPRHYEHMF